MSSKNVSRTRGKAEHPATVVDPITVEVVQNAFLTIIREMRATIVRTAFGVVIREAEDFSCALLTATGDLVSISEGTPVHLFPGTLAVRAALEKFGDDIAPGDVIMVNEPYILSSHLNDVALLRPYFEDGELSMWVSVRAHYLDIGGMTHGSLSPIATEIHQEGVRIPFLKVYEAGVPNQAVLDMLWANIRLPEDRVGDFMAMLGAMNLAHKRLAEVFTKYGRATVDQCTQILLDRAERSMRDGIAKLPPGEYFYHHFVESTMHPEVRHVMKVRVVIEGGEVTVDFTGSSPQALEPINGGEATGPGAAFIALKSLLDPHTPFNGGSFRPIKVIAEKGTIFNSSYPAACSCASLTMYIGAIAVTGALAQAVGEEMITHASWGMSHTYISGWDHVRDRPFVDYDLSTGGTCATRHHDGNNATANYDKGDFSWFIPVEFMENACPNLMVERNELREDSGGAGLTHGGLGVRRRLRVVDEPTAFTCLVEPAVIPPWGVFGGYSGARWTVRVLRDGQWITPGSVPGKFIEFSLRKGDLIEKATMGGGGYGDPLERDPDLVAQDLAFEYITEESARQQYGVVVRQRLVDQEATTTLRQELRHQRLFATVYPDETDAYEGTRGVVYTSPETLKSLGATSDTLVEMVAPHAVSLRTWLREDRDLPELSIRLGPNLRRALNVEEGQQVWVRLLE